MPAAHLEYIGVNARETEREYTLRLREVANDPRDFTLVITNDAFLSHRVRYQDAPEICYLKMQQELVACRTAGSVPASRLYVTDAELEAYRDRHAPKPPQRRARAAS